MRPEEVADSTFRAQSEGFRENEGVAADSETETYFKLVTRLTGPRWPGVPVTMQSGKGMGAVCKRDRRHERPGAVPVRRRLGHVNKVVFR